MSAVSLEPLRRAGRVAAAAREMGARLIVAGAGLREVCEAVEAEIERRGAQLAFPVQTSRNQIAAHYCPSPEDDSVYGDGDLAKLDIGVHVDGYVVDTALTVNVGDRPGNRSLVQAVEAALGAAIAEARPGIEIQRLSAAIEGAIRGFGLQPMHNLCGHGVGRWTVHCPPPIPNLRLPGDDGGRLLSGLVVAIEPFATDGSGRVGEVGTPEVFRLDPSRADPPEANSEIVAAIRSFRGLPFARRHLSGFPRTELEQTLDTLRRLGALTAYAPLAEAGGGRVAQAEHTLLVGEEGVEVLTL